MQALPELRSPRLRYQRLASDNVEAFHIQASDKHVRRHLLDGEIVDRTWCDQQPSGCSPQRQQGSRTFTNTSVSGQ
jgi:hypothetical protein